MFVLVVFYLILSEDMWQEDEYQYDITCVSCGADIEQY